MTFKHYSNEQNFWDAKGSKDYISLSKKDQQKLIGWIGWDENHGKILDIGGGSGMVSRLLNISQKTDCYCLDISHAMLKHSPVHAIQGDALNLPFQNNSFDLIIAAAFFHHLPGREIDILKECYRVLRQDGRIVGYDPNAHCIQNIIFMGDNFLRLSVFSPDEKPIKPVQLEQYTNEVGFKSYIKHFFSFQNNKITFFEFIQRYLIAPFSHHILRKHLERWFFWEATK